MVRRTTAGPPRGVSRRAVLTTATAICIGTVAGCLDDADEESDDDSSEEDESDGNEEPRALAAEMVEAIDDEVSVVNWELNGMFVPEYTDSRGLEGDVPILGDAYADIVDRGFDRRAMPTALDEDENVDFMVFLEPEWAESYLDGDWTEERYYTEIADSEH